MFLGKKNQYCERDYTTKCNLQVQCNSYQITNDILLELEQKNYNLYGNTKDLK